MFIVMISQSIKKITNSVNDNVTLFLKSIVFLNINTSISLFDKRRKIMKVCSCVNQPFAPQRVEPQKKKKRKYKNYSSKAKD